MPSPECLLTVSLALGVARCWWQSGGNGEGYCCVSARMTGITLILLKGRMRITEIGKKTKTLDYWYCMDIIILLELFHYLLIG